MNDPEAERCLDKAKSALQTGDLKTAGRLAQKAKRMFSATNFAKQRIVDHIISQSEQKPAPTVEDRQRPATNAVPPANRENLRHRGQPVSYDETGSSAPDFNPEQEAKCQAILRCKDYYKTLGVDKSCSVEEVKKAYRKLALQFHPDKARCPSAEAAFKELSKAYQCLSDSEARNHYDTYGSEETSTQPQHHSRHNYEAHFMTPEELFASFFGAHFARVPYAQTRVYPARSQQSQRHPTAEEQRRSFGLFQLFPLVALLLLTILSSLSNTSISPPFSLARTSEYSVTRLTSEHQLPYYVKPSFSKTYVDNSDRLRDLELQIEFSHFSSLCEREQSGLLQQLSRLKYYGTPDQYRKKSKELHQKEQSSVNCGNFRKLNAKYPRQAKQFYSQRVWV